MRGELQEATTAQERQAGELQEAKRAQEALAEAATTVIAKSEGAPSLRALRAGGQRVCARWTVRESRD